MLLFASPLTGVYLLTLAVLLGLVMGSALNCLAWRMAQGEKWSGGRSRCPQCGHELNALDLVPLFSYLFLRGRCRYCGEKISPRYAPESREALSRLVDAGIPVQSQTVLLRGVNDDVATLSHLFHQLTLLGVRPGYLFQCDLVPGTSHLRVPVEEGVALYHQLRRELSGLSCPVYAVDLPGGGGKLNLLELDPSLSPTQVRRLEDCYQFVKADGSVWRYPR